MNKKPKPRLFLDFRWIFSFCYTVMIIIGARGRGKTFGIKKHCLKQFFYKGRKFAWLRATDSALSNLTANEGDTFFKDMKNENAFPFDWEGKIDGHGAIYICKHPEEEHKVWEHAGYAMGVSTFMHLKGNAFNDIYNIVYDEFIAEKDEVIRGDRCRAFVNMLETVLRLRGKGNCRMFLMANALNLGDPILNLFFTNIRKHGIYKNKDKDTLCWYIPDSEVYLKAKDDSIVGKIIKDTKYADSMIYNKFDDYSGLYYESLPENNTYMFTIENGVYLDTIYLAGDNLYVYYGDRVKSSKRTVYGRKINDLSEDANQIPTQLLGKLRRLYSAKMVKFNNEMARTTFVEFIK